MFLISAIIIVITIIFLSPKPRRKKINRLKAIPKLKESRYSKTNRFEPKQKIKKNSSNLFLPKEEFKRLSSAEKAQLELDRYIQQKKENIDIGHMYERQIGRVYEMQGYNVVFHGINKGFYDRGIDLIVYKEQEILIIQAKFWAQTKRIEEGLIRKLHNDAMLFRERANAKRQLLPMFYTNIQYSECATNAARDLNVYLANMPLDRDPPLIKCNINRNGEKIYHLPFDKFYDKVKIDITQGECYVYKASEAENLGFRRARSFRVAK